MEHAEKRLASGHTLMTLDELNPTDFMMRQGLDKDFGVYILCRSGKRAEQAAEKFISEGYTNVHVIEGGIMACEEQGHELEGHTANENVSQDVKRPVSLERQVRIVAGSIVARVAVGTSLACIFLISIAAISGALLKEITIDWPLFLNFVGGGGVGMLIGSALVNRISNHIAKIAFAVLTTGLAIFMLIDNLYI
jgi:hypothetical protein